MASVVPSMMRSSVTRLPALSAVRVGPVERHSAGALRWPGASPWNRASPQSSRSLCSVSGFGLPRNRCHNWKANVDGRRNFRSSIAKAQEKMDTRQQMDNLKRENDKVIDEENSRSTQAATDAMTKGKLLTTPSRLFKLLLPLTTTEHSDEKKDVEPIAILVHPQQPLSYLKELIQSEMPPITIENGRPKPPQVSFIALQLDDNPILPRKAIYEATDSEVNKFEEVGLGEERRRTRGPDEDDESYNYLRKTDNGKVENTERFVRWSQATEIGDFVRDASRAAEFIISVEGQPADLQQIHVSVPSFSERTHFLRMRLRKISGRIQALADVKTECDALAHRGAQRVAIGGFGVLSVWWYLVYKLTFETDLGWDTMEPVTYLVSLSTLMGGYLWFLYHNREISYRSALDFTINARQKKLYQLRGVDLNLWASLIDEGNMLRKEIKSISTEYDVEWDEKEDEYDERVTEALKKERSNKNGNSRSKDMDDDDD